MHVIDSPLRFNPPPLPPPPSRMMSLAHHQHQQHYNRQCVRSNNPPLPPQSEFYNQQQQHCLTKDDFWAVNGVGGGQHHQSEGIYHHYPTSSYGGGELAINIRRGHHPSSSHHHQHSQDWSSHHQHHLYHPYGQSYPPPPSSSSSSSSSRELSPPYVSSSPYGVTDATTSSSSLTDNESRAASYRSTNSIPADHFPPTPYSTCADHLQSPNSDANSNGASGVYEASQCTHYEDQRNFEENPIAYGSPRTHDQSSVSSSEPSEPFCCSPQGQNEEDKFDYNHDPRINLQELITPPTTNDRGSKQEQENSPSSHRQNNVNVLFDAPSKEEESSSNERIATSQASLPPQEFSHSPMGAPLAQDPPAFSPRQQQRNESTWEEESRKLSLADPHEQLSSEDPAISPAQRVRRKRGRGERLETLREGRDYDPKLLDDAMNEAADEMNAHLGPLRWTSSSTKSAEAEGESPSKMVRLAFNTSIRDDNGLVRHEEKSSGRSSETKRKRCKQRRKSISIADFEKQLTEEIRTLIRHKLDRLSAERRRDWRIKINIEASSVSNSWPSSRGSLTFEEKVAGGDHQIRLVYRCAPCGVDLALNHASLEDVCAHIATGVSGAGSSPLRQRVRLVVDAAAGVVSSRVEFVCAKCGEKVDAANAISHAMKHEKEIERCFLCEKRVTDLLAHERTHEQIHRRRLAAMAACGCAAAVTADSCESRCPLCQKYYTPRAPRAVPEWLTTAACSECAAAAVAAVRKKRRRVVLCSFCREGKFGFDAGDKCKICTDCLALLEASGGSEEECFNYVRGMLNELLSRMEEATSSTPVAKSQPSTVSPRKQIAIVTPEPRKKLLRRPSLAVAEEGESSKKS